MGHSRIDFSAQFGGSDAATSVLPHFRVLKAVARELSHENFPYEQLAYILRVDGEVTQYGIHGCDNVDTDKQANYLSVDIGVSVDDRGRIADVISAAILSSPDLINSYAAESGTSIDLDSLRRTLGELCSRYLSLASNITAP
jgi:hypothetical protein